MERTQISLSREQRSVLDAESARTGKSVAQLIREAVDARFGAGGDTTTDIERIQRAAGAWPRDSSELPDGATYVERLRSGRRLQGS